MSGRNDIEALVRPLAPQVLAALVRRHGRFDLCEDAVQEALLAAVLQWPRDGAPENRPHPAGGGRSHHGADRECVRGAGGDNGPADQPGQANDQGERDRLSDAVGRGPRAALCRRAARPLPDLQRGSHGELWAGRPAARSGRRGDPNHPHAAPLAASRRGGQGPAQPHAAHACPASGAQRTGRTAA